MYKLNVVNKKGEYKNLKPIWIGSLLVTQVLSPVLYKVKMGAESRYYIMIG